MWTLKTGQKPTLGFFSVLVVLAAVLVMLSLPQGIASPPASQNQQKPILAQRVTEELVAQHPEIASMEVAATPPHETLCVTIAATEAKEVGAKCDDDEFTAMKTDRPFVEKEDEGGKEVYDATLPLHDASAKIMGTIGMDFKPAPGQQQSQVVEKATQIVREFEKRIPSHAKLFAR